jgi:hypothetical protein
LCNSIPPFQSGSSTTLKDTGIAMDLSYGIGSAEGEYFKDNFVLGGNSSLNFVGILADAV